MADNNVGVIVEQGFVAGTGLGFTPTTINEQKKNNEKEKGEADKK